MADIFTRRIAINGTSDTGITPLGVWLISQWCRFTPVFRTLPLGTSLKDCREITITFRRAYTPHRHGWWRDWYIPFGAPMITIWRRRDPKLSTLASGWFPQTGGER